MYRRQINAIRFFWSALPLVVLNGSLTAQSVLPIRVSTHDSVAVAASQTYSQPSLIRRLFMGSNYRKEWETPVALPIFDMASLGLTVKELGGGKQTKSLRLLDRDSVEWALRTVDKDVRPAIPKIIRNGFTVSIVQDMVSAAHPFAPLTIPPLATATGVQAGQPSFYFVPDDTALGPPYRELFAGKVCLLEKRDLLQGVELRNTEKMLQQLFEDHHSQLDQAAYLNARLLDMQIADWDRHYDQWKWAAFDSSGKTTYVAIPKDRDQAYFSSNGWLLKLIRLFTMKYTIGLTEETSNIVNLNGVAWSLDRLLLNELPKSEWVRIANTFQQNLTDDLIREAVKRMPAQEYAIHGEAITNKLLLRKKTLPEDVLRYYRFLAKEVTVYGTDKAERFELTGNSDSVTVTVRGKQKEDKIYYQRTFYTSETKKITLLGLDGDDLFVAAKDLHNPIRFEVNGGSGSNKYEWSDFIKVKAKDSDMDSRVYLKKLRKPLRIREEEKNDDEHKDKSKK
ncbi:hypothetical protein [Flavisolibacter nicotianae]|uniref:hypothetical protein n=1 Tax=Flavisolibacter nicotianae TaxID=2364882 RepID=UPI0013C4FC5A|nr:hypothetical protein [Flavisolibacter nicotianae]